MRSNRCSICSCLLFVAWLLVILATVYIIFLSLVKYNWFNALPLPHSSNVIMNETNNSIIETTETIETKSIFEFVRLNRRFRNPILKLVILNESHLAAISENSVIIEIWNYETAQSVFNIVAHTNHITGLTMPKPSQNLISASADGWIKVWNVENKSLINQLYQNRSIQFLNNASYDVFFIAGYDMKLWNLENEPSAITMRFDKIMNLEFFKNTNILQVGVFTSDKYGLYACVFTSLFDIHYILYIMDTENFNFATLQTPSVAIPNKKDKIQIIELYIFDYLPGQNVMRHNMLGELEVEARTDTITCLVALSIDLLAAGFIDGSIKIWNLEKYQLIATVQSHNHITSLVTLLDNFSLASGHLNGQIRIWNLTSALSNFKLN